MRRLVCKTETDAVATAARLIVESLTAALEASPRVSLMVSGGATPKKVLPIVAATSIDWSRVTAYASDERCVPADHPDSTEAMVKRVFSEAGVRLDYLVPPAHDQAGADLWWDAIRALPSPSVAFLGIGDDGHTASLFPHRPEERIETPGARWAPETPPHKHARITLTTGALARAARTVLIANTRAKQDALDACIAERRALGRLLNSSDDAYVVCSL
jgi:6-phosphogluconolactonase